MSETEAAKSEKLHTVNELSVLLDRDPKTIRKALHRHGVKPAGKVKGNQAYRSEDVEAALRAAPDTGTKEKLALEKLREARLKNDAREGVVIPRKLVNATLAKTFGDMCRMLDQKLENEYPALCVGLDVPGIRAKGKQLNDSIRAEWRKLLMAWPE